MILLQIPPAALPGDGTQPSRADIVLTLVDRQGVPIPASDVLNAHLFVGARRLTVTGEPVEIELATQGDINGETFYQVQVRHNGTQWERRVQVPALTDGTALTWEDFISLGAPVAPTQPRWLPDPSALDDGLWLVTRDHRWVSTDVTPSGISDAPLTDGPYGRQGGAWVDVARPISLVAAGTLSGHRAIAVDADGLAIYADQGDETALAVVGISTQAATVGDALILTAQGPLDWPAGGLTPDAPLFLGAAGALTHTAPTTGWVRQIAQAVDPHRLVVSIGPAYRAG